MKALISKNKNLQKYISEQEELLVHPAAVNEYSCIIGKHKQYESDPTTIYLLIGYLRI